MDTEEFARLTVTIDADDWGTIAHIIVEEDGAELLKSAVVNCDSCQSSNCQEDTPNWCSCPCYGCKHNCGACWCDPCKPPPGPAEMFGRRDIEDIELP